MPDDKVDPVVKRLDVILRLLLEYQRVQDKELIIGDQLIFLESTGLAPSEAARILGLDPRQLSKYRLRAKDKKRKGAAKS